MYKSTIFSLKKQINQDFNLKNTILFFGFKKNIIFASEINNK